MQITQSIQIPKTPMFINGAMDQAWYMFFFSLSQMASKGEEIDTTQLLQLASQLPTSIVSNEVLQDIEEIKQQFPPSPLPQTERTEPMPLASVFCLEKDSVFPVSQIPCEQQTQILPVTQITSEMQVTINGNN